MSYCQIHPKSKPLRLDQTMFLHVKKVWIEEEDKNCLVVHTALKMLDTCLLYLDSGYSRHMTGDKSIFKTLRGKEK